MFDAINKYIQENILTFFLILKAKQYIRNKLTFASPICMMLLTHQITWSSSP